MATGYRNSAGQDLELVFQAGTTTVSGYRKSDGSPLQFAARGSATKIADVGYRDAAGADVSNTWLGASVAPPVSDGGLPSFLESIVSLPSGGGISATCGFSFLAAGVVTWDQAPSGSGSGTWLSTGLASDYDVRLTDLGSTGGLSGATGTWQQMNVDRAVTLTASIPPSGSIAQKSETASVRMEIRRRSDSAVLLNRSISLYSLAERIA